MSTQSKNTTSTQTDPALMSLYTQNNAKANATADTPFTRYDGQMVAPFSATQVAGQQGLIDVGNSNIGADSMASAKGILGGLSSFQPPSIMSQPVTASSYNPSLLKDVDLSSYESPFTKDVVNTSIDQNERARQIAGVNDSQRATAAGAFGGSRSGVSSALTNEAYDRNSQANIAALNEANFTQAQNAAMGDVTARNTAGAFNANLSQNASMFNSTQGYNAQSANAANDIAGAGVRANAGSAFANISQDELAQALQKAGVIEGVGQEQTGQQQSIDAASYQEFLRQLAYPIQQQDIRNSSLGIIPKDSSTTSSYTPGILDYINAAAGVGKAVAGAGGH